jgi:3-deoxy-manno-octulosonate cytidylyltransferase (CMP-KDO synthetase)
LKRAAAVIPVRYDSRRFPGKALAPILGKPMIQWVYEGVKHAQLVDRVILATDDRRIQEAAQGFGAEAVMTSRNHGSGTDRTAEVAQDVDNKIIINVQGDEPMISGRMVDSLIEALQNESIPMASLMTRVTDLGLNEDPNKVKVVVDREGYALYFSRSALPYQAADFFWPETLPSRGSREAGAAAGSRERIPDQDDRSSASRLERGYAAGYNQGRRDPEKEGP